MESEDIIKQSLGDKYEILSVIGKGGMATVYKAIKKSLNRPVALKVIHQNLVHDDEFIKRFIQEAQVCASLNHPNIVTVYDVDSIGTVHFMSMEYLQGMTLREKIQSHGNLEVEETVNFIAPIAQALGYIHKRGIVHRDVKSSNIIITSEGRPVLMDFGIAYSEGRESLSQSGTVLGTPEYMSPEQAEGKIKADGRSDIYSLGVIMFECLTGRLPFHSESYISTIVQVIQNPPPSIKSINSLVPDWLNNIVQECLVKDRNLRISDGHKLADALRNKVYHRIEDIHKVNDPFTRKIIKEEIKLNKVSKGNEERNQLQGVGKRRKPLLLGIFVTLVIILIILGVLILSPKSQHSNSYSVVSNLKVTIPEKVTSLPKVTTTPIERIDFNYAISGGTISDNGGSTLISEGICWGTSHNPTILESHTTDGKGIESFSSRITGLFPNTLYYVRAYATNNYGIAYGKELSFTTLENIQIKYQTGNVTDIEGNVYKTVTIGQQVWMAENLKTTKLNDDTFIPLVLDNNSWDNLQYPAYCWYNNDANTHKETYGALYNWYTVNTGKLCPLGWHLPTNEQWSTLINYLGGVDFAGGKLKETGTTYWISPNMGATNETGFAALPGGFRGIFDGAFNYSGSHGGWWSSTEYSTRGAYVRLMDCNSINISRGTCDKRSGYSVRCLRD